MSTAAIQTKNLNDARSSATRARLIDSTIASLIEVGFTKTTGVEVCRRASLTRGALNHHFQDFSELLVSSLQTLYARLFDLRVDGPLGSMERLVKEGHQRVTDPGFKAVIELWMASRNDPQFGQRLANAITEGSHLFAPEMVLTGTKHKKTKQRTESVYRTIVEALIGIGLGRAVGNGEPMAHETMVLGVLQELAQQHDQTHQTTA